MRLSCRVALGVFLLAALATDAQSAPIVPPDCPLVPVPEKCTYSVVAPFEATTVSAALGFESDVALFRFDFAGPTDFFAATDSPTLLGLFDASGLNLTYPDPLDAGNPDAVRYPAVSPDGSLQLTLNNSGTYYLALLHWTNNFSVPINGPGPPFLDSLVAGFGLDAFEAVVCTNDCNFTVDISATPVTAAVPEPGTLSLLALGSACAGLARRRRMRRQAG